jgi:hypothetical protein
VGDRIGPKGARIRSAQFGYFARLLVPLAACALGLSGASAAAAIKPSGAARFKRPAVLSSAERSDSDQVNVDRLEARVGLLKSSAVLEAIAGLGVPPQPVT